jgi:hypothetical protein
MPKFFEEFSSKANIYNDEEENKVEEKVVELPLILKGILGAENSKTKALKYYEITKEQDLTPVLDLLDLEPEDVKYKGEPLFSRITLITIMMIKKGIVIIMINLTKTDFNITQDIIFSSNKNIGYTALATSSINSHCVESDNGTPCIAKYCSCL